MNKKKILIFTGAGASKAVNPEAYPTTVEFFEKLPSSIKNNLLFKNVVDFLNGNNNSIEQIDIEAVLWQLQKLRDFCHQVGNPSDLVGWMLANNRLNTAINQKSNNFGHLQPITKAAKIQLNKLIDDINEQVYDFYSTLPTKQQLDNTWIPLLEFCSSSDFHTEIITTNYDLIIEEALDCVKISDKGWKGENVRILDEELWLDNSSASKGLLTKLHGSLNWTQKNDNKDTTIYIGSPLFTGNHDSHLIIYPGFKGKPELQIFKSFHDHFGKSLESADFAVFIGFAFRDDYINNICERYVTKNTKIIIINPLKTEHPFNSNQTNFLEKGFEKDTVMEVIKYIDNIN